MSTVHGGQGNIVTNGLILNLDAANPRSYAPPFNGTTWQNLVAVSGSISGSLINGPVFSTSGSGCIVFDGSNDYMTISSLPALGTNHSLCFWLRIISITSAETQIFMPAGDIASVSITNSKIGSWNGSTYRQSSTVMSTGVWFNFVMTCDGSSTIFYLNGATNLTSATTGNFGSGTGYVCSIGPTTGRYLNANLGNIIFYNRALSAAEVLQNFNATRARFGV